MTTKYLVISYFENEFTNIKYLERPPNEQISNKGKNRGPKLISTTIKHPFINVYNIFNTENDAIQEIKRQAIEEQTIIDKKIHNVDSHSNSVYESDIINLINPYSIQDSDNEILNAKDNISHHVFDNEDDFMEQFNTKLDKYKKMSSPYFNTVPRQKVFFAYTYKTNHFIDIVNNIYIIIPVELKSNLGYIGNIIQNPGERMSNTVANKVFSIRGVRDTIGEYINKGGKTKRKREKTRKTKRR